MNESLAGPAQSPTTPVPAAGSAAAGANVEEDAGIRAQRAAEEHLVAIWEAEEALEDDPTNPDIDYPASAPWDGCDTCVVREVLHAAWPIIEGHFTATAVRALRDAGHHDAAVTLEQLSADADAPSS